ncbi:phage portal protein [Cellulosilyticum lentocellum]|uniref:Portal protein n=1 Tax=Cellulosilyticum lentocellum (strain ATCC 49066 / DSM 5427 / NCIMB 11756 / RHM5) TaxID=642492 RepID=F2JNC4_CELLD|nr:phage portal protein [Cellulosilyticum lentocellum]ADZ83578.1 portal protein [Cellulosilyticum lentocellum DSM 5427]
MGILDFLRGQSEKSVLKRYAQMMNGYSPVFSQFGDDIYASDIVQNAIRALMTEMSKLDPKHIRNGDDNSQSIVNSSINRLLKYGPNPLMTTSDFLEKITYLREMKKNVFIYPTYREIPIKGGFVRREYTGLYPLNPIQVDFLEDAAGILFIKFYFNNGEDYTLKYSDIIHWRKDFGANEFMGGDETGKANNNALLKLLKTNDVVIQSLEKGIKAGLTIRGILKIQTMLADGKQKEEREKFEKKLNEASSGILEIDLKNDFIPLNLNPKIIDKDTMEFIDKKILNNYGVSIAIINGDFTEEQYQSFYEKTLEPMIKSLGRAFSKTLFTDRELDVGNEIIFYAQGLVFTNMANKIAAVDVLSSRGTLTDNQILSIFGYPPFPGGDIRHMSLNFINREIADQYQMSSKVKEVKKNE